MESDLKDEDKTRIAAATQAVVNVRVMREIGRLVAKINEQEHAAKRAWAISLMLFVSLLLVLALVVLRNTIGANRTQQPEAPSTETQTYVATLRAAFKEATLKPCKALSSNASGTLTFSLNVLPTGVLENIQLRVSSGDKAFDDAAIAAIRTVKSVPPFPPEQRSQTDVMEITVALQVKDGKCDP